MLEVADAVVSVWAPSASVCIWRREAIRRTCTIQTRATFGYVARELGRRGLGFLFSREYFGPDRLGPQLKRQFGGVYIANERYTLAQANQSSRQVRRMR